MMERNGATEQEAIGHFKAAVSQGKHWYIALLEAMALWTKAEEEFQGQHYCYLIAGEAFDWLLLAQRLCAERDGLLPPQQVEDLLFHGKEPLPLSSAEMLRLLGSAKYKARLNYFYGIEVEEALQGAVEEEVRRDRWCSALAEEPGLAEEVFRRIYDAPRSVLLRQFRKERGYPPGPVLELWQLKEFTYYLFQYRLRHSEPARAASDTKKGLHFLHRQQQENREGV